MSCLIKAGMKEFTRQMAQSTSQNAEDSGHNDLDRSTVIQLLE